MKKAVSYLLPALTALVLVFTVGFYLGRNMSVSAVNLSVPEPVPAVTVPKPANTESPAEIPEFTAVTETIPMFPININTAQLHELMILPGIGEKIAARIIAYREANGPYRAVEELMNVEGIGEKRMEQLLDLVTIGG